MTDRSPITIDALLKRINRKLAPHGRIHKASPHEYSGGLGVWHVTENNTVSQTFDDIADFHQYAGDLGVLHDVAHVNFPEGYFPEGSGFEGVTKSLYADDDSGSPVLGLMWAGEDAPMSLDEIKDEIESNQLADAATFDALQLWFIVALRKTMPELSNVEFDLDEETNEYRVVEESAPPELIRYIETAFGVAQVHLSRLADEPPDDFETQVQSVVDQAANAIRARYGEAAA